MNFKSLHVGDAENIRQLFTATFSDSEGGDEGKLIGNLAYELLTTTESPDICGFVAVEEGETVGAIIFSRMTFESHVEAFLLAPVAVMTGHQGKGIGQKLIRHGLDKIRANGVELVVTYGDPRFYTKLGFEPVTEDTIQAPLTLSQPEGWMAMSLIGDFIAPTPGRTQCVKALDNPAYW